MLRRASLTTISDNKTSRKKLDLLTKGKITRQAELEATLTQISRNLNVLRTIINKVLERLCTALFKVNKLRSGRPLSIISRAARILLRQLRSKSKIIWRQLKTNIEIDLNARTLNATLRAYKISHWLALKRPKLTSEAARLRLKWAKTHEDWIVNQWRKVIWSNETFVTRESGKTSEWVFETRKQKWDRDKVMEIPNEKAFFIMIWEAFWDSERSNLYLLDRDFEFKKHDYSAVFYLQILEYNLTDIWKSELVFMQNNASIHRVRKSKLWFQENGIEVMKWPSYSLDLNSIENLWALLKKKIYKVYSNLNSLKSKGNEAETQLFQILQRAWANLRKKIMKGLIFSMPERCAAVIIANGWHIKYWLGNHNSYTTKQIAQILKFFSWIWWFNDWCRWGVYWLKSARSWLNARYCISSWSNLQSLQILSYHHYLSRSCHDLMSNLKDIWLCIYLLHLYLKLFDSISIMPKLIVTSSELIISARLLRFYSCYYLMYNEDWENSSIKD